MQSTDKLAEPRRRRHHLVCILTLAIVVAGLGAFAMSRPSAALAWKPGGHFIIAEKVQRDMEPGVIKSAMAANPDMSYAWGSYGADLGYGSLRMALPGESWAAYADLFHYQKVGSFAQALLQNAIQSGRSDQIAYAAGWLTHVCGDMYVHHDVVNPHAGGVFFDKAGTIPGHREIEADADPVMWIKYGGKTASSFNADDFPNIYHRDMPIGLRNTFAATVKQVCEKSPSSSQAGAWFGGITHSDATMTGDDFEDIDSGRIQRSIERDATGGPRRASWMSELDLPVRGISDADVFAAADKGAAMATWLLDCAQRGDYSAFSDTWNLDVGPGSPDAMNSLVVEVTTDGDLGDGTNSDVDLWIADEAPNGTEPRQTSSYLDHTVYDDFEMNDRDLYSWYFDPSSPSWRHRLSHTGRAHRPLLPRQRVRKRCLGPPARQGLVQRRAGCAERRGHLHAQRPQHLRDPPQLVDPACEDRSRVKPPGLECGRQLGRRGRCPISWG